MKAKHALLIACGLAVVSTLSTIAGRSLPTTSTSVNDREIYVSQPLPINPIPAAKTNSVVKTATDNLPESTKTVFDALNIDGDFSKTEALYNLASNADSIAIKRLIKQANEVDLAGERLLALNIFYLRLSELQPETALKHYLESSLVNTQSQSGTIYTNLFNEPQIIHTIFSNWAKSDLDAAIRRTRLLKSPDQHRTANNAILQVYADRSPDLLQSIANRLTGPKNLDQQQARTTTNLASNDPIAALEAALELLNRNTRLNAVSQVATTWAKADAQAALNYAVHIEDQYLQRMFRFAVLNQLATQDPETALAKLDSGLNPSERSTLIYSAMQTLSQVNPRRAMAIAANFKDLSIRNQALSSVFNVWANNDVRSAADALAQSQLGHRLISDIGYSISYNFAAVDPAAALIWAERMEGKKGQLWNNVVYSISERDPLQALQLVSNMRPSVYQQETLSNLIGTVAYQSPLIAMEYLNDLPPGQYRNQTTTQVIQSWSGHDAKAALDWVLNQNIQMQNTLLTAIAYNVIEQDLSFAAKSTELIPKGSTRSFWIATVLDGYLKSDPHKAAGWVSKFRSETDFPNWIGQIAAAMVDIEPRAGSRLINTLTDIEKYTAAQTVFAQTWIQQDAEAAARWLIALPNEKRSEDIIRMLASSWHRYDPDKAERWIKKLKTSEERDTAILGVLADGRNDIETFDRLVSQLHNPDQRQLAITNKVITLAEYDPNRAWELLDQADLSGKDQDDLISLIEQYQQNQW